MAFNLKKLRSNVKAGIVKFEDGSTLNFEYRPNAYTPDHEDMVEKAKENNKSGDTLKAMMIPLLASWDVVDEVERRDPVSGVILTDVNDNIIYDEVPVPIDEVGLGRIPFKTLGEIMDVINKDMSPGESNSTNSSGSFG